MWSGIDIEPIKYLLHESYALIFKDHSAWVSNILSVAIDLHLKYSMHIGQKNLKTGPSFSEQVFD